MFTYAQFLKMSIVYFTADFTRGQLDVNHEWLQPTTQHTSTLLWQWCNMQNITDVYLNSLHRHRAYKHDVSKANYFRLQVWFTLKRHVCILIGDGKNSNTHQWCFACFYKNILPQIAYFYLFQLDTPCQTLLRWSNQGGRDGQGKWHVHEKREIHTGFWWEDLKETEHSKT